jgi:hypothetical protein
MPRSNNTQEKHFMSDHPTTYLRPEALAERWATTPKTLASWRHRGQGPTYIKIGSAVRYALTDVLAYERAGRTEAVA